jgi:cullin-associated NEDD8-dissociated protein 1
MRCHELVGRLAAAAPGAVTASLDRLVEPLAGTLAARVKADAVKQEVDRNEDQLRSCLRAVDALARLPGAPGCAAFRAFVEGAVQAGGMRERYAAVREERREAEGGAGRPGSGQGFAEGMDLA